ncbi:mechanosensitive ion channel family protein [archaeon]|jgi:MscS family membrane protein|nr:mechanosensitive ion channel family protein [archaeon]MBT7128527.1 mechanosensitive ion channel family protein [archaeon]
MLEEYIGNAYLRAGAVFLIVFLAIRILMFFLARVVPVFTRKTKTNLDDVILRKSSMPLTLLALLAGVRFAIGELNIEESLNGTIEGIILTFMIVFVAVLVYYIVDALVTIGYKDFGTKVKGRVNESLLQFFHSMLAVIMIVVAFLVILASWGIAIGPLLAGLGVAGIAIAFALQSTLANVFGGISMILDRSISVGDLVNLDDGTAGYISKINLRSTKIRTFNNKLVIVPNGKLSESNIKNVALPGPETRVVVPFGVAYGSDVKKVKKLALGEIKKVKGLFEEKDIVVRFMEMADSSLNFKAYFYITSFDDVADATDDANTRIYNALNKAGIEIPFPQMDVNLKR